MLLEATQRAVVSVPPNEPCRWALTTRSQQKSAFALCLPFLFCPRTARNINNFSSSGEQQGRHLITPHWCGEKQQSKFGKTGRRLYNIGIFSRWTHLYYLISSLLLGVYLHTFIQGYFFPYSCVQICCYIPTSTEAASWCVNREKEQEEVDSLCFGRERKKIAPGKEW